MRGAPADLRQTRDYGLPTPNHNFLEAHPTLAELLMRLGSGDANAKPDIAALHGDAVRFVDGSVEEVDVIIYATGYNITFPFFDPGFLSAPANRSPALQAHAQAGLDDLVFVGFAQAVPDAVPVRGMPGRLLAAYLAGHYRPPGEAEMHRVIAADERSYVGHFADKPRHTQQVDYFDYERECASASSRRAARAAARPAARRGPRCEVADRPAATSRWQRRIAASALLDGARRAAADEPQRDEHRRRLHAPASRDRRSTSTSRTRRLLWPH